ncbi:MAG: YihY/virulence factor BrkB family protein [Candidatus Limnocylindria bacterium]
MLAAFADDDCAFLAGAVAYQIFFALVPLLALVVGVLGFAYGEERARAEAAAVLQRIYPAAGPQETRLIEQLVEGRALALGLGAAGTLLSVTAIHSSLDSALAAVLSPAQRRRTFVRGKLAALAFVAVLAGLAVLSFAFSYGLLAAQELLEAAGLGPALRFALQVAGPLVGVAVGYVLFYLVYRAVPRRRVGAGAARWAALVSAVLWEVAKVGFGLFTRELGAFQAYGALAFAAGLLTWIYVTAAIILIGAEVIKTQRSHTPA